MDDLIRRYPMLETCRETVKKALDLIIETYENGGKVLVCGNGGSAADSEHIVGELMKGFCLKREVTDQRIPTEIRNKLQGALPAISLPSQVSVLTAYINDVDPEMMYAQLVLGYAKENDLLIALSTSGNSKNVVNAVKVANALNVKTLSMTGNSGGILKEISTVTIAVPENETFKIQEYHLPIYHYLCYKVEEYFFK